MNTAWKVSRNFNEWAWAFIQGHFMWSIDNSILHFQVLNEVIRPLGR